MALPSEAAKSLHEVRSRVASVKTAVYGSTYGVTINIIIMLIVLNCHCQYKFHNWKWELLQSERQLMPYHKWWFLKVNTSRCYCGLWRNLYFSAVTMDVRAERYIIHNLNWFSSVVKPGWQLRCIYKVLLLFLCSVETLMITLVLVGELGCSANLNSLLLLYQ